MAGRLCCAPGEQVSVIVASLALVSPPPLLAWVDERQRKEEEAEAESVAPLRLRGARAHTQGGEIVVLEKVAPN